MNRKLLYINGLNGSASFMSDTSVKQDSLAQHSATPLNWTSRGQKQPLHWHAAHENIVNDTNAQIQTFPANHSRPQNNTHVLQSRFWLTHTKTQIKVCKEHLHLIPIFHTHEYLVQIIKFDPFPSNFIQQIYHFMSTSGWKTAAKIETNTINHHSDHTNKNSKHLEEPSEHKYLIFFKLAYNLWFVITVTGVCKVGNLIH